LVPPRDLVGYVADDVRRLTEIPLRDLVEYVTVRRLGRSSLGG
jgi:hypothetical protein